MAIEVKIVRTSTQEACAGSGGLKCQIAGCAATVSAFASATGGIGPGAIMECDRK